MGLLRPNFTPIPIALHSFLISYKIFHDGISFAIVNNSFLLIFDKPLSRS